MFVFCNSGASSKCFSLQTVEDTILLLQNLGQCYWSEIIVSRGVYNTNANLAHYDFSKGRGLHQFSSRSRCVDY